MSDKNIFIIDDDVILADALSRGFTQRNYQVTTAYNLSEAITYIESQPVINYAVIDLNIHGESGLALVRAIHQQSPEAAIVVLTGYSSISTSVEAIKLGATNYLCKPATVSEIIEAFEHIEGDINTPIQEKPLSVDRLEWEYIQKTLKDNDGNVSKTARELGMHRRTLQRKLQKKPVKQ